MTHCLVGFNLANLAKFGVTMLLQQQESDKAQCSVPEIITVTAPALTLVVNDGDGPPFYEKYVPFVLLTVF